MCPAPKRVPEPEHLSELHVVPTSFPRRPPGLDPALCSLCCDPELGPLRSSRPRGAWGVSNHAPQCGPALLLHDLHAPGARGKPFSKLFEGEFQAPDTNGGTLGTIWNPPRLLPGSFQAPSGARFVLRTLVQTSGAVSGHCNAASN